MRLCGGVRGKVREVDGVERRVGVGFDGIRGEVGREEGASLVIRNATSNSTQNKSKEILVMESKNAYLEAATSRIEWIFQRTVFVKRIKVFPQTEPLRMRLLHF